MHYEQTIHGGSWGTHFGAILVSLVPLKHIPSLYNSSEVFERSNFLKDMIKVCEDRERIGSAPLDWLEL